MTQTHHIQNTYNFLFTAYKAHLTNTSTPLEVQITEHLSRPGFQLFILAAHDKLAGQLPVQLPVFPVFLHACRRVFTDAIVGHLDATQDGSIISFDTIQLLLASIVIEASLRASFARLERLPLFIKTRTLQGEKDNKPRRSKRPGGIGDTQAVSVQRDKEW